MINPKEYVLKRRKYAVCIETKNGFKVKVLGISKILGIGNTELKAWREASNNIRKQIMSEVADEDLKRGKYEKRKRVILQV